MPAIIEGLNCGKEILKNVLILLCPNNLEDSIKVESKLVIELFSIKNRYGKLNKDKTKVAPNKPCISGISLIPKIDSNNSCKIPLGPNIDEYRNAPTYVGITNGKDNNTAQTLGIGSVARTLIQAKGNAINKVITETRIINNNDLNMIYI